MANKMTQREFFNEAIKVFEGAGRPDLIKMAEARIALLDKKSANRKPTKVQTENEALKVAVAEVLAEASTQGRKMTVSEVIKSDDRFEGMTPQKVSALLKQMVEAGAVVKTVEKRVSLFALAE